jgi:thiamine-monophosphate kinase
MIDLSDGLATDAAHVGRASGVSLRVPMDRLPVHPGVLQIAGPMGLDPLELACAGGEDYELCVCVAPGDRAAAERALADLGDVPITWIGDVVAGDPGVTFIDQHGLPATLTGYEHRWA